MRTTLIAAGAFVAAAASPAAAQLAETPEIAAKLPALGQELSREMVGGTFKLYAPLLAQVPTGGLRIAKDVAYGAHERHRLDVFAPKGADGTQPILVYVHGGGFVRGDKGGPDTAGIGPWFAARGVVTIPVNYRFAPEARWPAGAEDLGAVIDWIKANPALHGGDPSKIILAGNSAGSMHVADYVFREDLQREEDGVIGAVVISPPTVDLAARPVDPKRDALYYGTDGDRAAQSVVNAVEGRAIPVLIAWAEHEPAVIADQTARLWAALAARDGRPPLSVGAPGHNHISVAAHMGTADETLSAPILGFIRLRAMRGE